MSTTAEKPKPFLLPEYCKGCGRCIEACARSTASSSGPRSTPRRGSSRSSSTSRTATACGLCMTACPEPYGLAPEPGRATSSSRTRRSSSAPRPFARRAGRADPRRAPRRCRRREPLVIKGTYASAIGALLAGCRHFFGYPITPSTEGAELMAKLLPKLDGVFVQAVSEVATVNMMYGCGGAGLRVHDLHLVARASA